MDRIRLSLKESDRTEVGYDRQLGLVSSQVQFCDIGYTIRSGIPYKVP